MIAPERPYLLERVDDAAIAWVRDREPTVETPVRDAHGRLVDAVISYPLDFTAQMLEYTGAGRL